jgi:S-adenosylmethionine decarboxylase
MSDTILRYCGRHLILDIWTEIGLEVLGDLDKIQEKFIAAAEYAGATVLNHQWHHFGLGNGITGVVMLAESHMSIHTWPEHGFAAIDVFMCGDCDPKKTLKFMRELFQPRSYSINEITRGLLLE